MFVTAHRRRMDRQCTIGQCLSEGVSHQELRSLAGRVRRG
jgi:hypothetical protein